MVLTVENTGEKLTPQLVSTLGEPFQRATKRIRTDHAGVGLGLAIVKSITQAHDGALTLTPRAAGGLRVSVQLPAAPPQTADHDQGIAARAREEYSRPTRSAERGQRLAERANRALSDRADDEDSLVRVGLGELVQARRDPVG